MKKIIAAVLIVVILTVFASCGELDNSSSKPEEEIKNSLISALTSKVDEGNLNSYDFSAAAFQYLTYIGENFKDRNMGKEDHDKTADWIVAELKKGGYNEEQIVLQKFTYSDYDDKEQSGANIVLTVEGEDNSHRIIAGAHYDGDGIGDNGSGIALLLANAVGLAKSKPHFTVTYIFFDAEECGCKGSNYYAENMSEEEVKSTIYMINIDSLAFGDYCNIYGGDLNNLIDEYTKPSKTDGYEFAAKTAESIGFNVMRTADLDGYYEKHKKGPEIKTKTLYTNPWTFENQSPVNYSVPSPATLAASDHTGFMDRGIEYIYFEATNWFAEGENDDVTATSYTGYVETIDYSIGAHGMFMNTEYDTWELLNKYFPGRAEEHYKIYSPLLSSLIMVS